MIEASEAPRRDQGLIAEQKVLIPLRHLCHRLFRGGERSLHPGFSLGWPVGYGNEKDRRMHRQISANTVQRIAATMLATRIWLCRWRAAWRKQ
jgi:hypothetical protein